jgi:2-keto-4-pentenoate hydratase/2-oxohepta-3-ene-1,7-dioic acid hydratase in catechol pathway
VSKRFDIDGINHLVLAGWAGRDQAAVEAHIRELEALGAPRPTRTPVFYRVATSLLTTGDAIEVVGEETTGEVEYVLVMRDDGLWLGLGSDHTDRGLERSSVALSKQICAKVAAPELWRVDDVVSHWDHIILRSWAHRGGERYRYQEGTLASLLPIDRLISMGESAGEPLRVGSVLFGGTIATVDAIAPADEFEMEMDDPVLGRTLQHRYRIRTLPVNA